MMFRVSHTTPARALRHLLRLKREGENLLERNRLSAIEEGRWKERVFRYLSKIADDPKTFESVIWRNFITLSPDDLPPKSLSEIEISDIQKKHVQKALITLESAIEQFEAQYEK